MRIQDQRPAAQQKIQAAGDHAPSPINSFEEMAQQFCLSNTLIQNIKNCGYTEPTPIQSQAIPAILQVSTLKVNCFPRAVS